MVHKVLLLSVGWPRSLSALALRLHLCTAHCCIFILSAMPSVYINARSSVSSLQHTALLNKIWRRLIISYSCAIKAHQMLWRSCKGLLMGHCLTARDKKVLRTFECVWTKNARLRAHKMLSARRLISQRKILSALLSCMEAKIKCVQSKLVLSLYYFFSPFFRYGRKTV